MGITLPSCCYFYDASRSVRKVTYKAKLLAAYSLENLRNKTDEHKFIPEWRAQCFEGLWSRRNRWVERGRQDLEGKRHTPSMVWIKLKDFEEFTRHGK